MITADSPTGSADPYKDMFEWFSATEHKCGGHIGAVASCGIWNQEYFNQNLLCFDKCMQFRKLPEPHNNSSKLWASFSCRHKLKLSWFLNVQSHFHNKSNPSSEKLVEDKNQISVSSCQRYFYK